MTNQDAFDAVWDHFFVKRREPVAITKGGVCKYRGPRGTKCAIGILMPDSEYQEVFDDEEENMQTENVISSCPSLKDLSEDMLSDLQSAHDCAAYNRRLKREWRSEFRESVKNVQLKLKEREYYGS